MTAKAGDNRTFWVINADRSGKRPIPVSPYAINAPPCHLTAASLPMRPGNRRCGAIRIVDIDTGGDHT